MNMQYKTLVIYGFMLVAVAVAAKGIRGVIVSHASNAVEITAVCVEIKTGYFSDRDGMAREMYCPVYRYEYDGKEYFASNDRYSRRILVPGREYSIKVDSRNPEVLMDWNSSTGDIISIVFGVLGTAFTLFILSLLKK